MADDITLESLLACDTEVRQETILLEEDLTALESCELPDDSMPGITVDYAKMDQEIDDIIAAEDEKNQKYVDNITNCVAEITAIGQAAADDAKTASDYGVSSIRLQELVDNLYPLYIYHQARLDYYTTPSTMTLSYVDEDDLKSKAKSYINDIETKYTLYSGAIEVKGDKDKINTTTPVLDTKLKIRDYLSLIIDPNVTDKTAVGSNASAGITILNEAVETVFSGLIYIKLYNLMEDPMKYFITPEERKILMLDDKFEPKKNPDGSIDTGATSDDPKYAAAEMTPAKYAEMKVLVDDLGGTIQRRIEATRLDCYIAIESDDNIKFTYNIDDSKLLGLMRLLAQVEVYSATINSTTETTFKFVSNTFLKQYNSLIAMITKMQGDINTLKTKNNQDEIKKKINNCGCVKETKGGIETDEIDTEPDLYDTNSLQLPGGTDPLNPTPVKHCYWVKFAKLATQYGLLPFPDTEPSGLNSMRYWPSGLLIPTPAKIIKIPLPIVWIPIVTISSAMGIMVVFIGQNGIFPMPYILYISNSGIKSFILAITISPPSTQSGAFGYDEDAVKPTLRIPLPSLDLSRLPELEAGMFNILKEKTETFEQFTEKIKERMYKRIDAVGAPKMTGLNKIKKKIPNKKAKLTPEEIKEVLDAITTDMLDYIDTVEFPKIKIPENGKGDGQLPSIKELQQVIKSFKFDKLKAPGLEMSDLRTLIKLELSNINLTKDLDQELLKLPVKLDLTIPDDFDKVKKYLKTVNKKVMEALKNNPLLASLSMLPTISVANPFKCKGEKEVKIDVVLAAMLVTAIDLINGLLDGLRAGDVISLLGTNKITRGMLTNLFRILIDKIVPPIPFPDKDFGMDFVKFFKGIITSFAAMSLPKLSLEALKIKEMIGNIDCIVVDLNTAKEPIKKIIEGTIGTVIQQIGIAIDLAGSLGIHAINGTTIKVMLKNIIAKAMTDIMAPFKSVYDIASAIARIDFEGFSGSPLDLLSVSGLVKLLKKALKSLIASVIMVDNPIIIDDPIIIATALELLSKLKNIPYPAVGAVCAFSGIASDSKQNPMRILHPMLMADDLPPWERLSLKNFLFVVFLDEFCRQAKQHAFFPTYI